MSTMQSVISGRHIPKELAGMGVSTGFQPPSPYESRLLISGPPGSGKSTFLNSDPNILVIDEERGGLTVADPQALRFTAPNTVSLEKRWAAYEAMIQAIISRKVKGADDIKMIAFDSINEMVEIFSHAMCIEANVSSVGDWGGGYGAGYAHIRRVFTNILNSIYQAGMGWALIVHSTIDEESKQSKLDLSAKLAGAFHRKCEHFLWVCSGVRYEPQPPLKKKVGGRIVDTPQPDKVIQGRFLQTSSGGLWNGASVADVKCRIGLPEDILLPAKGGFQAFIDAYNEGVQKLTQSE